MNRPDTHVKDLTLLEKYMAKSIFKPGDLPPAYFTHLFINILENFVTYALFKFHTI